MLQYCLSLVGILYGTMTLELGGKVTIECEKTKCVAELEFKLKVYFQKKEMKHLFNWLFYLVSCFSKGIAFSFCSLQPFLGGSGSVNQINGKIFVGEEVLATVDGHWVRTLILLISYEV